MGTKKEKKQKIRVFFTMNSELYTEFEKHIDNNLLDQSKVLEKLIDEYLKNKEK